ncbi:MAG: tetratricopeptide repeat protein [Terracidiphilus sp.]
MSSSILGSALAVLLTTASAFGQTAACPTVQSRAATPADAAYADSNYAEAEQLYAQALAQQPSNSVLGAALVHTLLHEGKVAEAAERVQTMLAADPHATAVLTAEAEVQLRQGQPWQAMQSLDAAEATDRCYARIHLIRSRVLRIDSMYASERAELQKAYEIDATDPDILNAWSNVVSPANEIAGTRQSLDTMKDIDADTRQKAEATVQSMMPLLSEYSQTCKVLPSASTATLPLLPSKQDGKNIDGFRIEVHLPKSAARLQVDTAASGLFITRALATQNGLQQGANDPPGTVHLESVQIGPLEFRDCMVGVTDAPFAGNTDGSIGTDVFASYLIKIDPRAEKLTLGPLPAVTGILPGDRPALPELARFTPVYHRRQYLLVPVMLNNKTQKLFVLDTGMRLSTMTSETAHTLSNIKVNFTNTLQTASGPPAHVYRDKFDFQFANLVLPHQSQIVEFDPTAIDRNAGFEVDGLLGFDMLHQLTLQLDYRDGLVQFESTNAEAAPANAKGPAVATASTSPTPENQPSDSNCAQDDSDHPLNTTIEATVQGTLDSAHLKPGKEIWVKTVSGYTFPGCTLNRDSIVYGRVIAASGKKNSAPPELSIAFDHGDCQGQGKKELSLRLIGLLAPPSESEYLHQVMPTEVAGGARQISDTAAATDGYDPKLGHGSLPAIVHPGLVVGMPNLKLEPEGGPGCSSRISSPDRNVELQTGVELILMMYGVR